MSRSAVSAERQFHCLTGAVYLWVWIAAGLVIVPSPGPAEPLNQARISDVLTRFYAREDQAPLWFDGETPRLRARALVKILEQAGAEGLNPDDYPAQALRRDCLGSVPPDARPACEWRLSETLLRYGSDVGYGRFRSSELDPNWHLSGSAPPTLEWLQRLDRGGGGLQAVLDDLPPPHKEYRRLRQALADYQRLAASGGWAVLPEGPSLRPEDRSDQIAVLRRRLEAELKVPGAAGDPDVYDAGLAAAVRRFQALHGLDEDGIVGRQTRAALNLPISARIAQLRLNMERWRWMPRQLGDTHVLVNLAAFQLTLVQGGDQALQMRAINGRPDRTSPSFQSEITRLVFNPDWTVPRRLAVEDMLPQLQRDPGALQEKHIRVYRYQQRELVEVDPVTVAWEHYHRDNFPFVLRQEPGPHNSLGRLKFDMPNPFDIYIHDTPALGLFNRRVRSLSSGCIRVEQAVQLASRLLGPEPVAAEIWVRRQLTGGTTRSIPLSDRVPVYLVYLTAWADELGNLHFRNDIYGRDARMADRFSFP